MLLRVHPARRSAKERSQGMPCLRSSTSRRSRPICGHLYLLSAQAKGTWNLWGLTTKPSSATGLGRKSLLSVFAELLLHAEILVLIGLSVHIRRTRQEHRLLPIFSASRSLRHLPGPRAASQSTTTLGTPLQSRAAARSNSLFRHRMATSSIRTTRPRSVQKAHRRWQPCN